jgi:uncharacterized membrane-anchored protein
MVTSLIGLIIYIIVIGVVFWLLSYLIDNLPMDESFRRVAKIVLMVASVLIVIVLLLQFVGAIDGGVPRLGRP